MLQSIIQKVAKYLCQKLIFFTRNQKKVQFKLNIHQYQYNIFKLSPSQILIFVSTPMSLSSPTLQKSKSKSGLQMMKSYLLKKAQNMYKLNLSDEQAFKWKFNKTKNNRPLSSFRLIKKQPSSLQQLQITLQDLRDYRFPVLAYKTRQLATFAQLILSQNEFFTQQINDTKFLNKLITEISINYNIVSYHNFSHAFSLSLMLFQCMEYCEELHKMYTPEERYYALLAGLAHDLNHPGTNNAFQVKTKSARALQFNNESVLENFHVRELWKLLQKNEDINFLTKVDNPQKVKKYITHLILMTDVAQHFKNLQKLKTLNTDLNTNGITAIKSQQQKDFFLGQLFHACDIGNPCIDFDNYISWAALLSYEFNEQTILEQQLNVEVTQMLRYKDLKTFYNGQLGFINFMVLPLWKEIAVMCKQLFVFVENCEQNAKMLKDKIESEKE